VEEGNHNTQCEETVMNHVNEIISHSQKLPENLQKEVLDFIYFLETRYSSKLNILERNELTDKEVEKACGILQAPHGVTLAQMEEAIKKRGAGL
jgi:hypothetical protein